MEKPVFSLPSLTRRALGISMMTMMAGAAWAQDPPIKLLVGFPAGGSTDVAVTERSMVHRAVNAGGGE